jgi:small subunit ribosomal protein S1
MSDTDTTASETATANAEGSAVDTATPSSTSGAVDTGRRIDPALLARGAPSLRRGGRAAPPEEAIRAPDGAEATPPGIRVVTPQRRGPVLDAAAIAARAATSEAPAEGEAPAAERPRRDDRGPRRDGGAPGGRGGERGPGGGGGRPGGRRDDRGRGAPEKKEARVESGPRIDYSGMAPIVVQRDEDIGDFAAMFEATGKVENKRFRIGDRVKATVVHVGSDSVFFEISRTQQAHAARGDFLDDKSGEITVKVGDVVDAFVTELQNGVVLSSKLGRDQIDVTMLQEAKSAGIPVDGTITGVNKGGFEVELGGNSRGFCPTGQIDVNFVEDPQSMLGKTLHFLVKEVKEGGKNVLLSRRALIEKERKEQAKKLLEKLAVGLVVDGTITRIQPFGAFVDLGGLDGLIPVSELSYGRIGSPEEVVKVGQQVTVEVLRIEEDPKRPGQQRIGLSMKAHLTDPLVEHTADLAPDTQLVGRITRLEAFGAFVELFPGVEGLVHVSEITDRRIRHPEDVLQVNEHVQVRVKEVDLDRRRVSLTMKESMGEPVAVEAPQAARAPAKPRLGRGTRADGVVERIEKFGVFVNLFADGSGGAGESLGSALMPASETGTPRGSDLGKAFPIGSKVAVLVIDIDDRNRLKVSKTAREQAEERAVVDQYKTDKSGGGKAGLGTFGDLLKKFNAN